MKGDFSRDTFDPRKHYAGVLQQQGRVQLDADWNEQENIVRRRLDTEARDIVGDSGAPVHNAGFKLTTADGKAVTIGAGRYYAGGILCENENAVDFTQQPDLTSQQAVIPQLQAANATVAVIYLEAWRRAVSAIDDPELRETALGGPDTAIRAKTVWHVKALPVKPVGGSALCGDTFAEWDALVAPSTGLLSARAQPSAAADNPCLLPPGAGYQRLENQLYRVEVHDPGSVGTATFKWSRDNGSVMTAVESFNGQQLVVHDLGRDAELGFSNGQTVELIDDGRELAGQPGQLLRIDRVVEASRTVVLTTAPVAADPSLHPKLVRWEAPLATIGANLTADGWSALESGVQVKFEARTYKTGDYWTFAARTATANVDWPFTAPQPPHGEPHSFVRLGIATLSGAAITIQDCRKLFTPLAEVPPALHVVGIGWVNDDVMPQNQFQAGGLQVVFDGPVKPPPGDAAQAVMTVTLEAPVPLTVLDSTAPPAARVTLTARLASAVSFPAQGNAIRWSPGADLSGLLAFLIAKGTQRVRVRVRLEGASIWSGDADSRTHLDGATLGQDNVRADGSPRIDLALPSGDGRRASDFNSWFYVQLQLPPATLIGVAVTPEPINAGSQGVGTVTLDNPAPTGGVTVTLASSSAAVTLVTPTAGSVQIAAGATSATFGVNTSAQAGLAIITATAGGVQRQTQVTVQVVAVTVAPAAVTVFSGGSQQFTATVSGTNNTAVTWSVQGAAGGSVSPTGFFTAGAAAGDSQIIATSAADPSKTGTAVAHVTPKNKEGKEGKEHKDGKEGKDGKEVAKEHILDKVAHLEVAGIDSGRMIHLLQGAPTAPNPTVPAVGRAFIRPEERPRV